MNGTKATESGSCSISFSCFEGFTSGVDGPAHAMVVVSLKCSLG